MMDNNNNNVHSLATRLCYDLTLLYIEACTYTTVGHLVHTIATRGRLFPTELLVYRSAIYPQWKTFKYGLGGRLQRTLFGETTSY